MLKFSLDRIFKAKGIDKPFTFLINQDLSDNFATKLKNDKVKSIGLKQLEKLCIAFRCTPNDLLDWHPDKNDSFDKDHPLHTVTKSTKVMDMRNIFHSIPMDEIEEIESFINDKRKAREHNTP